MRRRFTAQQWTSWFDEFDASDISVKTFCQRKHVSENTFYQWRRRLKRAPAVPRASSFVPVAIAADDEVKIELPCGVTIRVPNDPDSLRPVFQTLLQIREASS